MFNPGRLVSTLLPAVFPPPAAAAAHFFPAFHARLASPAGHLLFPGPFVTYESLRSYLQPGQPGKAEAFLLASHAAAAAAAMGRLTEGMGEPTVR